MDRKAVARMSVHYSRIKKRHLWLSLAYRLFRLPWASGRLKLSFFLNLNWLFGRLAHEEAHRVIPAGGNPFKGAQEAFLKKVLPSAGRALDIGCGHGYLATFLAGRGLEVVALDHDQGVITAAGERHRGSGITFIAADVAEYIRSCQERFPVVVLSHVLEHLENPVEVLSSISRVGSNFFIEVPDFEQSHLNLFREELGLDLSYGDADHVWGFDRRDLVRIIQTAGMGVVQAEYSHGVQRLWCELQGSPS